MNKIFRRTVALVLAMILMITAIPFTVYAENDETVDMEETEEMISEAVFLSVSFLERRKTSLFSRLTVAHIPSFL